MKFTTEVGRLREALDKATKAVPKSPSQTVFAGIRLQVTTQVTITGSDEGETTVTSKLAATDLTPGEKIIAPKPLQTYLASLSSRAEVTVTGDKTPNLTVQTDDGLPYTFRVMEGVTFPSPVTPDAPAQEVDLSQLPTAIRAVKPATGREKTIQLHATDTGLHIQTTDNYRMVRAILPTVKLDAFTGILPVSVLEQIGELATATEHHKIMPALTPDARGRLLSYTTETTEITTRLIAQTFPNLTPILDAPQPYSITLPRSEVLTALSRLASVADTHPVILRLNSRTLTMSSTSDNIGSGEESIDLDTPSPVETTLGLTLAYAKDALSSHESNTITLAWSDPTHPLYFTSNTPFPITTVVMPIRLPAHYLT